MSARQVVLRLNISTLLDIVPVMTPISRRTLFAGDLMQISDVIARPRAPGCGAEECQTSNVLVLPLAGVFAKHDGPRHFIATADHAVLVAADRPYRVSFPSAVGDRCLTLRMSDEALARTMPHA